jgi:hypothetical protein
MKKPASKSRIIFFSTGPAAKQPKNRNPVPPKAQNPKTPKPLIFEIGKPFKFNGISQVIL